MAMAAIKSFGGISPKTPARYLQDSQAQVALNCPVFNGALQPLLNVGSSVYSLPKVGTPLTIYRFGQDLISDTQYWFHWLTDVDAVRSQIPSDTSEWTFYTGDGAPKATYSSLALSGGTQEYPTVSRPLGIPAPGTAATVDLSVQISASAVLSAAVVATLEVGDVVSVQLDGVNFTDKTITTATASAIATLISTITGVTATEESGAIRVTRDDANPTTSFSVRYQTGTRKDTTGVFTYDAGLDKTASGSADTNAFVVITDTEIGSVSSGDVITVRTSAATHVTYTATGTFASASAFAAAITSASVVATAYGSCVVLTPGTAGAGASNFIEYKRTVDSTAVTTQKVDGSEAGGPATMFFTKADLDVAAGKFIAYTINGAAEIKVSVATGASLSLLAGAFTSGLTGTLFGVVEPFVVIKTTLGGALASLRIRGGDYPSVPTYAIVVGTVGTDLPETRVYTYTLVSKESGFEMESAPAPASASIEVQLGDTVLVESFATIPSGYNITHRRIYRAVSGVFLFVTEIAVSATSFSDTILAEDLGEELPSLTWLPPPDTLKGLTNLPNGILSGFTGRDVYFSEPFRPYAWPAQYQQSLDFPVVGLGRTDTTLVVLTTGTPYFIQGSSPDSMVVVKADIEQSCASKRSIVSTNSTVLYASPDGLVMLSPNGSRIVTEQLFTRAQWQSLKPDSIHAYSHDLKYVAFYDTGTTQGGFIFDLTTGQFILHDIYATAGYADLVNDKLFLAFADRSVKVWQAGAAKSYVWRSKIFSMPHLMGFACAQLEAEAYPMTLKVYADNSSTPLLTQTVTSREPFRLPVRPARDWEIQIEGSAEVFSVAIAQSMEELVNV